jgi:regulatory protein
LRRIGYLDDQRYARQWAEAALRSGRAFGPRLRLELLRRGVAEETVAEVLAELVPTDSEEALVRTILARRFPAFDPRQALEGERRRVFAYLQRRGFPARTILDVFRNPEPLT